MPGFVLPDALIHVDFSQTSLAGLELSLTEMSTQELFELGDLAEKFDIPDDARSLDVQLMKDLRELFERFSAYIYSWNLEKADGTPELIGVETLLRYPPRFTFTVLNMALAALNGATADSDLGKGLRSGPISQVASIPMDVLSVNPPN